MGGAAVVVPGWMLMPVLLWLPLVSRSLRALTDCSGFVIGILPAVPSSGSFLMWSSLGFFGRFMLNLIPFGEGPVV